MQNFRAVARIAALSFVVQITFITIGSSFFGLLGAIAGYAAGQLVPATGVFRLIKKSENHDRELRQRIGRYAGFAWAANIANAFVWSRAELFFLERYWGYDAVAMFTIAVALSNLAAQGPMLLTTGVLSQLSKWKGRNEFARMRDAYEIGSRVLAAIVFPAGFGMAVVMPVLLPLIYGSDFSPAVPAAIVLVCVAAVSAPNVIAYNLVQALERNDFIFVSATLGAILTVVAGFLLVPPLGLPGVVAARAIIQLLMIAAGTWFVTCRLGYRPPYGSLLRLLAAALVSAVVAAICVWTIGGGRSLFVAVPAALLAYILGLRLLRALTPDDLAVLTQLARVFPPTLARAVVAMVELLRPRASKSAVAQP